MALKRIEALADAIAYLNKAYDPVSDAYQLRNPGLARVFSFKDLAMSDNKGRRIFTSWIGGYRFLVQDLTWKCSGETRAKGSNGKLKPTSSLFDLLLSFQLGREENLFELIDFLNKALGEDTVSANTDIGFFLEDNDNGGI